MPKNVESKSKKPFTHQSVVRILLGTDRKTAIGAIIEAEALLGIRQDKEIKSLLEMSLDEYFDGLPSFFLNLIKKVFPNIIDSLTLFLSAVFSKYLKLLPEEELVLLPPKIPPLSPVEDTSQILNNKIDNFIHYLNENLKDAEGTYRFYFNRDKTRAIGISKELQSAQDVLRVLKRIHENAVNTLKR